MSRGANGPLLNRSARPRARAAARRGPGARLRPRWAGGRSFESRPFAAAVGFGDRRVVGIGQHQPAETLEAAGVLDPGDAAHALDALGRLSEFELDRSDLELVDGVFEQAVELVVAVGLKDDVAEAAPVAPERGQHLGDEGRPDDPMAFDRETGVLGQDVLPDDSGHSRQGGPGEILAPGQLGHGRQDHGRRARDRLRQAEARPDVRVRIGRDHRIGRQSLDAEDAAVDGEMREVQRIGLLRRELVDVRGERHQGLRAAYRRQADVAGPGAVRRAGGAHAGDRGQMSGTLHAGVGGGASQG